MPLNTVREWWAFVIHLLKPIATQTCIIRPFLALAREHTLSPNCKASFVRSSNAVHDDSRGQQNDGQNDCELNRHLRLIWTVNDFTGNQIHNEWANGVPQLSIAFVLVGNGKSLTFRRSLFTSWYIICFSEGFPEWKIYPKTFGHFWVFRALF